jgi:hypothetical protein
MRARHLLPAFTAAGLAITALWVFGASVAWASVFGRYDSGGGVR